MLLARQENLDDVIVRILINSGSQKVENLHITINKGSKKYSTAAVYKTLKKLADNGVLIYGKNRYSISQSWLFTLSGLVDSYFEHGLEIAAENNLPPHGGTYEWRYTDLKRLNYFASSLILTAARQNYTTTLFSWNPFLWFNLIQPEHEQRYYSSLRSLGIKMNKLIGPKVALNKLMSEQLPKNLVNYKFLNYREFLPDTSYSVLVGSYIVSMKLQRKTAENIALLFSRSKDLNSIDIKLFLRIFKQERTPAVLIVEHDSNKAESLLKKFRQFEGGYS